MSTPCVAAVFAGTEVPNNPYGLIIPDQQVLCTDTVRFAGDQVAAVIAETPEQANGALRRLRVRCQDLPVLDSTAVSFEFGAPQIHPEYLGSILSSIRISKRNPAGGFARSALISENGYHSPDQEHAYLKPEKKFTLPDEQ